MNSTDEHLRRFLVRYGEALSTGDLKAISGCYAVPSLELSDTGSVSIAAREEIEATFDGAEGNVYSQSTKLELRRHWTEAVERDLRAQIRHHRGRIPIHVG
jgi:hypothetical protein